MYLDLYIVIAFSFSLVQCSSLTDPNNGIITCLLGDDGVPSYEDTCSFTCNTGYELTGSNTRTCQSDGSWSGSDAECRQGDVTKTCIKTDCINLISKIEEMHWSTINSKLELHIVSAKQYSKVQTLAVENFGGSGCSQPICKVLSANNIYPSLFAMQSSQSAYVFSAKFLFCQQLAKVFYYQRFVLYGS